MPRARRLEAEHRLAQIRRSQPERDLPAQYPPVVLGSPRTLSGDHQRDARAFGPRDTQEAHQRVMRLGLRETMEVDTRIDAGPPAGEALPQPAIEAGQRGN